MTQRASEALRDLLNHRAAEVPVERDPYGETRRGIRRARRRRWLAMTVSLCLVAAVAVPLAVFRPFRDVPLEGWHARGSLAGDTRFLDAVREMTFRRVLDTDPELVEHSRVLYAGDAGGYRRVVLAYRMEAPEETPARQSASSSRVAGQEQHEALVLLRGEVGAEPDELRREQFLPLSGWGATAARGGGPEMPTVASLSPGPGAGEGTSLFFLGPPGTQQVSYSAEATFHPDGTWERSWRNLPVHDGVVAAQLQDTPTRASAGLVRVRTGEATAVTRAINSSSWRDDAPESGELAALPPPSIPQRVAFPARQRLYRATGISIRNFDMRMVWEGRHDDQWLAAATTPRGVTFQVLSISGRLTEIFLVPRGQAERPVGGYGKAFSAGEFDARVVVVAPRQQRGSVQLLRGKEGERLATASLGGQGVQRAAIFDGDAVRNAVQQDARLHFRVLDGNGDPAHSGRVRLGGEAPWNQVDQVKGRQPGN